MTEGRLAGCRAIVTGAADGIGAAIAALFAREGAKILAVDLQRTALDEVHRGCTNVATLVQDVAAPGAAERILAAASEALGGLDILVNNAGVRGERGRIDQVSDASWNHVMEVNLGAAFRLCRAAAPALKRSRAGRILNIGSIQGLLAAPTLGAYVASKHGLNGLTRALALDLGPEGITANCIMPGFVLTGLTRDMEHSAPEIWQRMMARIVIGRPGRPEDIAQLALFLASPEAGFVTGACIPADGGMSCWS